MSEQDPTAQTAPGGAFSSSAQAGTAPPFPDADEARKWKRIEPDHLEWRRNLVERQLRQERLDQWIQYCFRLLEYVIVIAGGVMFFWLGKYAVDHHASFQAVPLIGGGIAGLAGAVLAVRNRGGADK